MKKRLIIIGAGGHGKVVLDTVLILDTWEVLGFADENLPLGTTVTGSFRVLCRPNELDQFAQDELFYVIAIGDNKTRQRIAKLIPEAIKPATIIHPSAVLSPQTLLGEGCVILAQALIHCGCKLGEQVIVNAGVKIDHDCQIGSFAHLSLGTLLGSMSTIGEAIRTENGQNIPSNSQIG